MMTITYPVNRGIYINMTNRCPCACTFCLRQNRDSVYGSDPLWLDREPTVKEVCDSIDAWNLAEYDEIVFCGYGEPTERLDDLLLVAKHIREVSDIKIRINTNGLADLIAGESTAHRLEGLIDTVS
ncbi:MAG: TatD family nuclease-associated radical SAM protein, partial [Ruminiclostridium sp.]|nr:TatD family nuclease-associated radical SAM protein [Ruminiclostridium sp.]